MNVSANTPWRKSTRSGGNDAQCVEFRRYDGNIQVRDSKDPAGPILVFTPAEWRAFVDGVKNGELDAQSSGLAFM
jgi:hypothetical protein